jgi:hypothetical protein
VFGEVLGSPTSVIEWSFSGRTYLYLLRYYIYADCIEQYIVKPGWRDMPEKRRDC